MLGAIIGDIVGSRWEFSPTNDYNFELFSEKNSYTDDTICTIAVADALLKGRDYGESIHEWCRKYPHPMGGYGCSFRNWVNSDDPKPYNSFGNGSAMRCSPIGWWFETPGELIGEARRSAECTHNHEYGIDGAISVVAAVRDCRVLRKDKKGKKITEDDILWGGIDHATMSYCQFPQDFKVNMEEHRNKFDETCQGTVPVALWIVMHSVSFEDAIRQAVSLGADADTLGAIVGSIAEALWGIPEWMKKKAMSYLPEEMQDVVNEFHKRIVRLRRLTSKCQYYLLGDYRHVDEKNMKACEIERRWAHDLAKHYSTAGKIKKKMIQILPMAQWEWCAEDYDLPISLVGYIYMEHGNMDEFMRFMEDNYACRKPEAAKKKAEKEAIKEAEAVMHWKLGLGNQNGTFVPGVNVLPAKKTIATADSWNTEPMPDEDVSDCHVSIYISKAEMQTLRLGHIPEVQEDHWFMYTDNEFIRYYRSWTGMAAFEAHYVKDSKGYRIDNLKMNHALSQFGVNGDESGTALFQYLIAAEIGGDASHAWKRYMKAWEKLDKKYNNKND